MPTRGRTTTRKNAAPGGAGRSVSRASMSNANIKAMAQKMLSEMKPITNATAAAAYDRLMADRAAKAAAKVAAAERKLERSRSRAAREASVAARKAERQAKKEEKEAKKAAAAARKPLTNAEVKAAANEMLRKMGFKK